MKKVLSIFVMIFVLTFGTVTVGAKDIKVTLNGQAVDVAAVLVNNKTLLPARDIVELLGGSVDWNGEKRQATITKGDVGILLTIDSATAYVNDNAVELDVPAQIISGKTMIPLRFVATSLGVGIDYADGTVLITTAKDTPDVTQQTQPPQSVQPIQQVETTDTNSKFIVFWGNTGDKIHISSDCRTITNGALSGSLGEAKAAGHTNGWCGVCSKGWTDEIFLKDGNTNIK